MDLTREQEMQAYGDALAALAAAMAFQLDPIRFTVDLKVFASRLDAAGHGPSAGLLDRIVAFVTKVHLRERPKH